MKTKNVANTYKNGFYEFQVCSLFLPAAQDKDKESTTNIFVGYCVHSLGMKVIVPTTAKG